MFRVTGYGLGDRSSVPGRHRNLSLLHAIEIGSWFYSLHVKKFMEEFNLIRAGA
jgi:hypothetical protein